MAHAMVSGDESIPYEYQGHVVSNPRAELAVNNAKYIKACTELHMARRNIEFLWGFRRFVNLEVLWVNGNKLTALDNLETNFRLKKVYAHNNNIRTLQDTVQHCKFLDTLNVANNHITDLKATAEDLAGFQYLHNLELLGNPLAEEPNYRLYIIHTLPSLHVFDRHVVTDEERQAAKRKFGKRKGASNRGTKKAASLAPGEVPKQPLSALESALAREVKLIKEERKAKEMADLQAAYSAGARTKDTKPVLLQSAAMTMSRAKLAEESKVQAPGSPSKDWEVVRLTKLFKSFDTNSSGTISRLEFRRAVDEAGDMGKSLSIAQDSELMDRYFKAMDKDGDEQVGIREFVQAINGELVDHEGNHLAPLQFDDLLPDQALHRSEFLFKKAADIQAQLLPMPEDDPRRPALQQKAFRLSEKAAKLADMHFEGKRSAARASREARQVATKRASKTRKDFITFKSTVRVRSDRSKNATVSAIDSGSDSDTDEEDGKLEATMGTAALMRAKRRARKPRRVVNSALDI